MGEAYKGLSRDSALAAIRSAVEDAACVVGLELDSVYLFGSRARGEADPKSDWDILVVTKGDLPREKLKALYIEISRRLAEKGLPADIIIRTKEQVERAQKRVCSIEKTALREGVLL